MENIMIIVMALSFKANFFIMAYALLAMLWVIVVSVDQWAYYGLERSCRACDRKVKYNDGLHMGKHGFICNSCLHEDLDDTLNPTLQNHDEFIEEMDARGIHINDWFKEASV